MESGPYWIAFGDVHDDCSRLDAIPELAKAEGVIVTGDITFAGGIQKAARVMEAVAARVPRVYAQIGNMDRPEVTAWLEERGWNLHGRGRELFPGVIAVGAGASPPTPFHTPSEYPEEQLLEWMEAGLAEGRKLLEGQMELTDGKSGCLDTVPDSGPGPGLSGGTDAEPPVVLISHAPPHATACDRLTNGTPVGSTAVREFIEKHRPALCLCGHIHEARAADAIGTTQIINPGPLSEGGYIILRLEGEGRAARLTGELKVLA